MPSQADTFEGDHVRIRVNPSGNFFHLYNKGDVSEISLLDIANALSHQCRFTGHYLLGVEHYSVAEHSIYVATMVEDFYGGIEKAPPKELLAALLHDAPESYLSDIAAPFKHEIGRYYEKEALIADRIYKRYGIAGFKSDNIKLADWYALFNEARQLVCPDEKVLETWQGYEEFGPMSQAYNRELACWLPSRARIEFLAKFAIYQDLLLGEQNGE